MQAVSLLLLSLSVVHAFCSSASMPCSSSSTPNDFEDVTSKYMTGNLQSAFATLPLADPAAANGVIVSPADKDRAKRPKRQTTISENIWNNFAFSREGEPTEVFEFNLKHPCILSVTDYKCAGDAFKIYNRRPNQSAVEIGETSAPMRYDGCRTYASTPNQAFRSLKFSSFRGVLPPAEYSLYFVPTRSPVNGGMGAVRLTPIKIWDCDFGDLTVILTPFPWNLAANACRAFGYEMFQLEYMDNLTDVYTAVHECLGADSRAFLSGRHGLGRPEYVHTDETSGTGQIIRCNNTAPELPVVCRIVEWSEDSAGSSESV